MDRIIYNALGSYYSTLEKLGYMSPIESWKLVVLCFFRDFVYKDYRGLITRDDYHLIERALDCLYGSTCLIPYPDYLKMGKLHIGEMTEMAQRVKSIENTEVIKPMDLVSENSDIILSEKEEIEG